MPVDNDAPGVRSGNRPRNLGAKMKSYSSRLAAATIVLGVATSIPSHAEERIIFEFNDLQQVNDACRAVFVVQNGLTRTIEGLALRVVAFDAEQHAKLFLSLDIGTLPAGKTRVVRFDLGDGLACEDISRLLLDDVTSCKGGGLTPAVCLEAISLSSRAGVPIDY